VPEITVYAPEEAGIATIAGIREELLAAMVKTDRASTLVLDLSRTRKADSSLAQLIVALKTEAAAKGLRLVVKTEGDAQSLLSLLSCDSMDERAGGAK